MTCSKPQARANLIRVLRIAAVELKTEKFYARAMRRAVLDFYTGKINAYQFIDAMMDMIQDQFTRAWNEGAKAVGYDPEDQTVEDWFTLQKRIEQETDYILEFAGGIEEAVALGDPVEPFLNRVGMWANRYNEIVSWAEAYFGKQARLMWQLGATDEHCNDCQRLNKWVATALQWEEARARGIYPQSRNLECHGFHCQCTLTPTTAPLTPGNIPDIGLAW